MKPAPAPRGPDPFTVVHRAVAREPRIVRACGAPFGRSNGPDGPGWGSVTCPGCLAQPEGKGSLAQPEATPASAPTALEPEPPVAPPPDNPRPRRTLPST